MRDNKHSAHDGMKDTMIRITAWGKVGDFKYFIRGNGSGVKGTLTVLLTPIMGNGVMGCSRVYPLNQPPNFHFCSSWKKVRGPGLNLNAKWGMGGHRHCCRYHDEKGQTLCDPAL